MQNPPPTQQGYGYGNQYGAPPNAPLTTPPGGGPKDKAAIGLDANLASALGYPIGIIALIQLFIEKGNRFARFHALQSLLLHVAWAVIFIVLAIVLAIMTAISSYLGLLGVIVFPLLLLAYLGCLLFCAYKAYQGQTFKLPAIGDMAANFANKG
jgi:uncharacterized membrane protein